MRLLYLSLFLLSSVFFIEANEHLPFENIKPTSTFNILQDEQPTVTIENKGRVTTKINTVYTTIAVATSTSSLPVIYNVSDTRNPAQQQYTNGPTSYVKDPNKKNTVAEDLEKDKQALKRMSTILSLVGGLGVIAIVATIVIFTRMRSRHRKQREIDEEGNEGSTYELSQDVDSPNTIQSSITSTNQPENNNDDDTDNDNDNDIDAELNASLSSVSTCSNDIDRPLIEPSAPPALLMVEENIRHSIISKEAQLHNRRNVVSLSSQGSAPSPSAPTAKELDAMVDEHDISSSSEDTNQPHHHHHHHHSATTSATAATSNCSRCAPSILIAPELPPPAYTPSAPPHYALPQEPIVIESSLQSRRHSSGG